MANRQAVEQDGVGSAREPTDTALMIAFAGGDDDALASLHARHRGGARSLLRRFGWLNEADVDDVVQQALIQVWRNRSRFDASLEFWPWFSTILTRLALSALRARKRSRIQPLQENDPEPVDRSVGPASSAVWEEERSRLRAEIHAVIEELPPNQRAAMRLRLGLDGNRQRTYQGVALELGVALAAVKARLSRALPPTRAALVGAGRRVPAPEPDGPRSVWKSAAGGAVLLALALASQWLDRTPEARIPPATGDQALRAGPDSPEERAQRAVNHYLMHSLGSIVPGGVIILPPPPPVLFHQGVFPGVAWEGIAMTAWGEDDRFLSAIGGGAASQPGAVAEHWCYDRAIGAWSRLADLPEPRRWGRAVPLGGRLYYAGGSADASELPGRSEKTVFVYDPATNAWAEAPPMEVARAHFAAFAVPAENAIVVIGGDGNGPDDRGLGGRWIKSAEVWREDAPKWELKEDVLPGYSGKFGATLVDPSGSEVLLVGGVENTQRSTGVVHSRRTQVWDVRTGRTRPGPTMPLGAERAAPIVVRHRGRTYVLFGDGSRDAKKRDVLIYDSDRASWSRAAVFGETPFPERPGSAVVTTPAGGKAVITVGGSAERRVRRIELDELDVVIEEARKALEGGGDGGAGSVEPPRPPEPPDDAGDEGDGGQEEPPRPDPLT